jgi:hypothetical protein
MALSGRVRWTEEWRESRLGLRGITEVKIDCGEMWGQILGRMLPGSRTPRRVLNITSWLIHIDYLMPTVECCFLRVSWRDLQRRFSVISLKAAIVFEMLRRRFGRSWKEH